MTPSNQQNARVPTENQYRILRSLGANSAGLSFNKRSAEPLIRHGWVTAEWVPPYYQWVRITPDGLRALALAVERYGLPDLGPKPKTMEHYCGKCGSTRVYSRAIDVEIPEPVAA